MKARSAKSRGVIAVAVLFVLLFINHSEWAGAAEPIRIGVVFSITGWAGFIGTPERDSLVTVIEDVNRKGGVLGRPIELFVEDDQSNPTNAALAAAKLIRDKLVSAVIGPSTRTART